MLTPQEIVRLIAAAPGMKYKAALSAAHGAGLRASEAVALEVSDIDSIRTSGAPGGAETIVLVEDDEAVRATVEALLPRLGRHVLNAKDALGALTIIESGGRPILR